LVSSNALLIRLLAPGVVTAIRVCDGATVSYFQHFLEDQPSGKIDLRQITVDSNMAVDSGLYTFYFAKTGATVRARYSFTYRWDGKQWLIVSHHSSALPEK
jgi:hypothetical protein